MHRLRGFEENWYEASKTDGRCLEPVYRRSKSLSVQRVISRNPFCAVLSRSSLPKKGRRNEKPTKTMQLFNRARFLPFPLSFSSFIPLLFLYFQCSPGDRYPVSLGIVSEPVVKGLRYRLARKFNKPVEARWTTCLNRVDWSESLSLSLSFSLSLSARSPIECRYNWQFHSWLPATLSWCHFMLVWCIASENVYAIFRCNHPRLPPKSSFFSFQSFSGQWSSEEFQEKI